MKTRLNVVKLYLDVLVLELLDLSYLQALKYLSFIFSYLKDRGFGYLTVEQYDHKIYAAKAKSHTASVIFLGSAVVAFCFVIILRRSCLKPFDPDERLPGKQT